MEIFLDTANFEAIAKLLPTGVIYGVTTNPSILRKQFSGSGATEDHYYDLSLQYYSGLLSKYLSLLAESQGFISPSFPLPNIEVFSYGIDDSVEFIGQQIARVCKMINNLYEPGASSLHMQLADLCSKIRRGSSLSDHIKKPSRLSVKVPLTMNALVACRQFKNLSKSYKNINVVMNVTLCFSVTQALMAAEAGADYVSVFVGRIDDGGADGMDVVEKILKSYRYYGLKSKVLVASVRSIEHVQRSSEIGADAITMPLAIFDSLYKHTLTDSGLKKFCSDWNNV